MINLLAETIKALADNGKAPTDVLFVTTSKAVGSWDDFAQFSGFDYDNGYGGERINVSLRIVGDDWWLERGSYDGSEWWEFKQKPERNADAYPLRPEDLKYSLF